MIQTQALAAESQSLFPTTQETQRSSSPRNNGKTSHTPSLLRTLLLTYGGTFSAIALAKLANDALSFSGPLLLQLLVVWITRQPDIFPDPDPTSGASAGTVQGGGNGLALDSKTPVFSLQWLTPGSPLFGYTLAVALGLTSAVRAIINAHSGYQLVRMWGSMQAVNLNLRIGIGVCIEIGIGIEVQQVSRDQNCASKFGQQSKARCSVYGFAFHKMYPHKTDGAWQATCAKLQIKKVALGINDEHSPNCIRQSKLYFPTPLVSLYCWLQRFCTRRAQQKIFRFGCRFD